MGVEKSGVGAVSIRRREAVGLGQGDIRTKPILIIGTERQQTVQWQVSGVWRLREHLLVTNRPPNQTSCHGVLLLAREFRARRVDPFAIGPDQSMAR